MALTQMQIIQSLGEAMNWLERELSWGADPRELRHLIGRMGELYVAMKKLPPCVRTNSIYYLQLHEEIAVSANRKG